MTNRNGVAVVAAARTPGRTDQGEKGNMGQGQKHNAGSPSLLLPFSLRLLLGGCTLMLCAWLTRAGAEEVQHFAVPPAVPAETGQAVPPAKLPPPTLVPDDAEEPVPPLPADIKARALPPAVQAPTLAVEMEQQPGTPPRAPGGVPPTDQLPPPRPLEGFGPDQVRLPRLDSTPDTCKPDKYTPQPTEEELARFKKYVGEVIDPTNTFDLIMNRTRIMLLKEPPSRTQIGDETIATFELLNPRTISFLGKKAGTTVFNMWFKDPTDPTGIKEVVLSYLIRVIPDPEAKARLERVFKALADEINDTFPDAWICIHLVGDKIVVSGQAKDIADATQIIRIVRANAPPEDATAHRLPVDNVSLNVLPGTLPELRDFLLAGGPNIVNLLRVPGEQQVNLKVTVAEVSRTAARSIGVNFSITNNQGITVFSNTTGNLGGGGGGGGASGFGTGAVSGANVGGGANLPFVLDNGQISVALRALRNLNYARTLAEPNLTTMNGAPATFLAGGSFPVPVITGFTAAGLQGVSFVPFGVQLSFVPYITDRDRIRLSVQATVSTRDVGIGTNIGGGNVAGLNARTFTTTVELREGQTLAVAGLIRNDLGADAERVPFFGDMPVVGRLFAVDRIAHGDQELVVLVTPELVHPFEPKEVPPLPGSDIFEPDDIEFYLCGKLESRKAQDYNSQVRTDFWRQWRYHLCEDTFIIGPKGHTEY